MVKISGSNALNDDCPTEVSSSDDSATGQPFDESISTRDTIMLNASLFIPLTSDQLSHSYMLFAVPKTSLQYSHISVSKPPRYSIYLAYLPGGITGLPRSWKYIQEPVSPGSGSLKNRDNKICS
jgi:hypothetical protein